MKNRKKIKIKFILVLVLVILVAMPLTAHAQSVSSQMSSVFGDILQSFAKLLSVTLKILQRILWPIFLAIGGLLNNDLLFGYGMEERLLDVWTQIRNIVNVIFVVALLGVAFFNILAFKPDSEFALKTFLPKFAIALIAVNFSYVGMKIILDVSNVMTYAVFTLPSSIGEGVATPEFLKIKDKKPVVKTDKESKKTVEKICKAYYGTTDEFKEKQKKLDDRGKEGETIKKSLFCKIGEGQTYTLTKSGLDFFSRFNSRNVALIMAIQFMNVTKVDDISTDIVKGSTSVKDKKIDVSGLSFQLLFAVVLYIVYGAAYVAVFVVLLTRVVALWLFIALSPLIVLKYVLPQGVIPESGGDIGAKFVKNTFAPVLMGVPLTIGYIILGAFKKFKYGTMSSETVLNAFKIDNSAISDLQSMMIAFAAVAVVWVGVFAAANGTFAEVATDFIKQKVRGLGTKALQGLKMLPIVPSGQGGKALSLYQAGDVTKKPWERMMRLYGPNSLNRGKIDVNDINRIAKSSTATVNEGKRAIATGIETPRGQKAVYNLLKKWKERGGEQGVFAKEAIRKIGGPAYGALKTGKLGPSGKSRIKRIAYLKPNPEVAPSAPRRNRVEAGKGAAGAHKTTGGDPTLPDINNAESAGIVLSPTMIEQRRKLWDSDISAGEKARIRTEINGSKEMKTIRKALKAKKEVSAVGSSVNNVSVDNPTDNSVKELKKSLDVADKALKRQDVDPDSRKKLLGGILKKKFGDKSQKFLGDHKEIADLVTI